MTASHPLTERITLSHFRRARETGAKVPMLTCYDYSTARLMQEAGVPALLVGDSAASVILGHPNTLPVPLDFMIQITAAVRRGAPLAFLVADMPFGSYQASTSQGVRNACRFLQQTQCDAVKIEAGERQIELVHALADSGVAAIAHLGLRPQAVGVLGGYRYQGRTASEAAEIVALALQMDQHGASAILLEAVPPEVAKAVIERVSVPVIGCGAGPACHSCVIVTHDALGLSEARPRFVPSLGNLASPLREAFSKYVEDVTSGAYPAPEHNYAMRPEEAAELQVQLKSEEDVAF